MLEHGGRLKEAAKKYQIPVEHWIDLSTGINPNGWSVADIPAECWQRLPEDNDDLLQAAADYYGNTSLLPVAGSQAAIQMLPLLRQRSNVTVIHPGYAEHASQWQRAGHHVRKISAEQVEKVLPQTDVLVLINPNNPSGHIFPREQLLEWHAYLQKKQGWLLVDEAFIDTCIENSLSTVAVKEGLIILRSLGKFFGLAGVRVGFVIATPELLFPLQEKLGPWALSHPSRYVATAALQDRLWQQQTVCSLNRQSARLRQLLAQYSLEPAGGSALFQWIKTEQAAEIQHFMARKGILLRLFQEPSSIRLGLPKNSQQWDYLESCLQAFYTV